MAARDPRARRPSLDEDPHRRSPAISADAPATRRSTARCEGHENRASPRSELLDAPNRRRTLSACCAMRRHRPRSPARPTSTSSLNFGTLRVAPVRRSLGAATSSGTSRMQGDTLVIGALATYTAIIRSRHVQRAPADAGRGRRARSAACRSRIAAPSAATSPTPRRRAIASGARRRRRGGRAAKRRATSGECRFAEFYTGYRQSRTSPRRADRGGRDSVRSTARSGSARSGPARRRRSPRS